MTNSESVHIRPDQPLSRESALERDSFGRKGFAAAAVSALSNVSPTSGFVVSIDGAWGSGKTSALAMIESLLLKQDNAPIVVHFNPWLIGDRDALLRSFLTRISTEVQLKNNAETGRRLAKELNAYSGVFDLLKWIPGAEPLTSIVQSALRMTGQTVESIAEFKAPDIEAQKERVENALRQFPRPIVVIIDDIDRLFPAEVYEIARIVKAVGDLPNLGYILAWDPEYVSEALAKAGVPRATTYLDKIVQLRLPLPALSRHARETMINDALGKLPEGAMAPLFKEADSRLQVIYQYGLRDLLEQPRDFHRIFNVISVIEPALRGEVVLGDIIGLAALMTKAPQVYELLRRSPRAFVGNLPFDSTHQDDSQVVQAGQQEREAAIALSVAPRAVRQLVGELFPITADRDPSDYGFSLDGCVCQPARLLIALQLQVTGLDLSIASSRQYVEAPSLRPEILRSLSTETCIDFLARLMNEQLPAEKRSNRYISQLCLDIAAMVDQEPFVTRNSQRDGIIWANTEDTTLETLLAIISTSNHSNPSSIAEQIVRSPTTISIGMELLIRSFLRSRTPPEALTLPESSREPLTKQLCANVIDATRSASLWKLCNVGRLLLFLPELSPTTCAEVFKETIRSDETLDYFALALFGDKYDSVKGLIFSPPREDVLRHYCTAEQLKETAVTRLKNSKIEYPVKAAWLAIAENREVYAHDGSKPR